MIYPNPGHRYKIYANRIRRWAVLFSECVNQASRDYFHHSYIDFLRRIDELIAHISRHANRLNRKKTERKPKSNQCNK